MGHRTSVYLSDELAEAWRASGVALSELVRRGLGMGEPLTEASLRRVLAELLPPAAHATNGGTGTAEVPHTVDTPDTTSSGTAAPGEQRPAARRVKLPAAEPRAETTEPAVVPSSVPDLGGALTVASALPAPKPKGSCPHRMPRGAYCKLCQATA